MAQVIRAIYENGVLRPLDKLDLNEHEQVQISVQPLAPPAPDDREPVDPLDGLRVATGISDLAEHFDDYRFGRRRP